MGQWLSRARLRCRFSSSRRGWAPPSASPRQPMCLLRLLAFQHIPTLPTPSLLASNRVPIQTLPTLLCARIVLAFREPSLAPPVTRFVPWISRRPAAPAERREALMALAMVMAMVIMIMDMVMVMVMARGAPKEQLSQGTPTPNRSTKELVELTLMQELTPMPLLTMELSSPALPILRLQLSLAMLSNLTDRNKAVCK